jgi:cell division protein FtsW (lipid II flippase)
MSNPITPIWAVLGAIMIAAFYLGGSNKKDLELCIAIYVLSLTFMVLYSAGKDAEFKRIERWIESRKQSK